MQANSSQDFARTSSASAIGPDDEVVDPLAAPHQHRHRTRPVELGDDCFELLRASDLGVVDRQDHITFTNACASRSTLDRFDAHASLHLELALLCVAQIGDGEPECTDRGWRLGVALGDAPRLVRLELGDDDTEVAVTAATEHLQRGLGARLGAADDARQITSSVDAAPFELGDDVTRLHPRLVGRAAAFDAAHERAHRLAETDGLGHFLRDLVDLYADATADHAAARAQLLGDARCLVDRNGERDSHEAAGAAVDLRVDADHFAAHVDQRPARVAG